ncbi:AMP-binding protein [Nocardioides sp. W7]|uniref:class I adenylate-forming enzyme family protein n=1 Tax=Nocardioides sp. W7 TaxID=2931390 RepID=UPI001FCFC8A2|nr:AMP-binding protein [Nocardioides sp. W7]
MDSWVRKWATINAQGMAVSHRDERVTWGGLDRRVDVLAHRLRDLGVGPGDRVGCLMNNCVEFLETLHAVSRAGAVFVPVNVRYAPPELAFAAEHVGMSLLVTEAHFDSLVERSGLDLPLLRKEEWPVDDGSAPRSEPAARWGDDGFLLFTSGTTGTPRAVLHAHEAFMWGSMDAILIHAYTNEDRLVTPLPLCYTGGMNVASSLAHSGAELVLAESAEPGHLLELIASRRATLFHGVPTMCQRLADHPDWAASDLSSLRLARTGGAPVPAALMEAYAARDIALTQGYGLSESGGTGLTLPPRESHRFGKAGRPSFYLEAKVVDPETGEERRSGEVGEILLRGRQLMRGYWNEPEATAAAIRDGWLWTGDLGTVDDEGLFAITGRSKELIVTGGLNVYPAEVEHVLIAAEGVLEAAVMGSPSEKWGEEVVAVVVAESGAPVDEAGLIAFCRERLADYKCPKRVVLSQESLTRTASGKIIKREAAKRLGSVA